MVIENVGRLALANRARFRLRRVAGADRDCRRCEALTTAVCDLRDAGERRTQVPFDVDRERLERRDVEHAAALARFGGCGANIKRSRHHRKAVSVLPLPVGARISVDSPPAIAGQPSNCGRVGASNAAENHSRTAG